MQGVDTQPHIQLKPSQARPVAIVVGDPARAAIVADMCDEAIPLAYNREYRSFDCTYGGKKFIVCSHGVGAAGAAICFEELIACGVKTLIRAGTAGSLQPDTLKQGDVCIIEAAACDDGITSKLVPVGYPAIADPAVTSTLMEEATGCLSQKDERKVVRGITLTSDLFYPGPVLPSNLELWAKAKVDIVEMEVSALLIIARLRGVRAGALCCIDGSPLKWDSGNYDPTGNKAKTGKEFMLKVALSAAKRLS